MQMIPRRNEALSRKAVPCTADIAAYSAREWSCGMDETMLAVLVVAGVAVAVAVFVEVFVIAMMQRTRKADHLRRVAENYSVSPLCLR
jgi:hypothetical protein